MANKDNNQKSTIPPNPVSGSSSNRQQQQQQSGSRTNSSTNTQHSDQKTSTTEPTTSNSGSRYDESNTVPEAHLYSIYNAITGKVEKRGKPNASYDRSIWFGKLPSDYKLKEDRSEANNIDVKIIAKRGRDKPVLYLDGKCEILKKIDGKFETLFTISNRDIYLVKVGKDVILDYFKKIMDNVTNQTDEIGKNYQILVDAMIKGGNYLYLGAYLFIVKNNPYFTQPLKEIVGCMHEFATKNILHFPGYDNVSQPSNKDYIELAKYLLQLSKNIIETKTKGVDFEQLFATVNNSKKKVFNTVGTQTVTVPKEVVERGTSPILINKTANKNKTPSNESILNQTIPESLNPSIYDLGPTPEAPRAGEASTPKTTLPGNQTKSISEELNEKFGNTSPIVLDFNDEQQQQQQHDDVGPVAGPSNRDDTNVTGKRKKDGQPRGMRKKRNPRPIKGNSTRLIGDDEIVDIKSLTEDGLNPPVIVNLSPGNKYLIDTNHEFKKKGMHPFKIVDYTTRSGYGCIGYNVKGLWINDKKSNDEEYNRNRIIYTYERPLEEYFAYPNYARLLTNYFLRLKMSNEKSDMIKYRFRSRHHQSTFGKFILRANQLQIGQQVDIPEEDVDAIDE